MWLSDATFQISMEYNQFSKHGCPSIIIHKTIENNSWIQNKLKIHCNLKILSFYCFFVSFAMDLFQKKSKKK